MNARSLGSLFRQDLAVTLRNSISWVLLGTAVVMVLVVRFAIPGSIEPGARVYYHDATREGVLRQALLGSGYDPGLVLSTPEEVRERVAGQPGATGVIVSGAPSDPQLVVFSSGELSAQRANVIAASLRHAMAGLLGQETGTGYRVEFLREQVEPTPQNLLAVPSLLALEVLVTGFLLAAVMMFQEKQEGSLRAYQVAPGTASGYVLSKVLVLTVVSLIYGIAFILFTVGVSVNWLWLVPVMVLGAAFYTLVGMIVAVFFANISEWFFVGVGLLTINMLPMISYAVPTFSPAFITWIPSYPVIFGLRDALFPTGRAVLHVIWLLVFLTGAAYATSCWLVHGKLIKEGR